MTDRDQTNDEQRARADGEPDAKEQSQGKDIMRGRSFAGANIANTERDQTLDRQRIADHKGENLDEFNEVAEVTDAEIEARESNED